jgi:hypothetical protein
MTRLIDAGALRDKLQAEIDKGIPPFDDVMGSIRCGIRLARNIVEDEPTIDAEPVRHGKWITCTSSEHWKCSECGCRAGYWFNEENSGIESWEMDFSEWLSDYCPQCGADMRGEK